MCATTVQTIIPCYSRAYPAYSAIPPPKLFTCTPIKLGQHIIPCKRLFAYHGYDPRVLFSALHNITKRIELGASKMLCEILQNSPSALGYNITECTTFGHRSALSISLIIL